MISIITCSVDPARVEALRRNVDETIGVPYELIPIDNSSNKYGICAAYNLGGSQAQYPYLCFMHEDIAFETKDWGKRIIDHLSDPQVGLVGVAGGDARSKVPSSWSIPIGSKQIHLYQHYKYTKGQSEYIKETDDNEASRKQVVALDGVLLCTRQDVFKKFQFDASTFTGFHGYDIDFSLQVNTEYSVYVIFDVLLHHFSEGKPDRTWLRSAMLMSRKWRQQLPISVKHESNEVYELHHWRSMRAFLQRLKELGYPVPKRMYYLLFYSFNRYFSLRRLGSMSKFILSEK